MRFVIVAVAACWLSGPARAQPVQTDAVALLPLDADQRLEIYGQPVASELARALVAGGIDVVVVGPRMAVPERARLIVDGTIAGRGETVTMTLRIRDRVAGTVLDSLTATAPSLTTIDSASTDLAGRVLPAIRKWLAALHAATTRPVDRVTPPAKPVDAPPPPLLIAVTGAAPQVEALRVAFTGAASVWARTHHREARTMDAAALARDHAAKTVQQNGTDLGIAIEILGYAVEPGTVPTARARARVRIADPSQVVFDRVIVTDTIVGDRGLAADVLAARVAREVLMIVEPNLRRAIPTWR
ncbi:MAG: hypothetical protein JWO36_2088 [Myxococcales bacterium]|nr:hypothetical protein [Myxococcales bacterium]